MTSESKVIVTGIIVNTEYNLDTDSLKRPVAEITIYDTKTQEWLSGIYLVFTDNADIQRFKRFRAGTILLVTGELKYFAGKGYAIYVNSYMILEENKDGSDISYQKAFYFAHLQVQNFVFIRGHLVAKSESIISMRHNIHHFRGEMEKTSIQPLQVTNDIGRKQIHRADAIFIGRFTNRLITGECYQIVS